MQDFQKRVCAVVGGGAVAVGLLIDVIGSAAQAGAADGGRLGGIPPQSAADRAPQGGDGSVQSKRGGAPDERRGGGATEREVSR